MMEGHAAYTDARRGSAAPAGRGRGVDNRPAWMTRPDGPDRPGAPQSLTETELRPREPPVPAAPGYPQEAGTIVHLSRRLCGAFTSRRLDGSTATYYNGWYGFVRPDAATPDGDLFLHPSDAADDYNPSVGDRVTFRRGTHNGRTKAVEVRLIMEPALAVAPCWAAPARAVSPGQAPAMRGENRHVSLDKPRSSGRAPRPKVRFDPALEAAKPQWDTKTEQRRALAEARNAFDQTRIALQSCPYKFTTVLLKTSTYLVGIWWDDFNAYVTSHGVRWSVRRRATGCIGGGHAVYAVDLSFDPHAVAEAAGRLEAAPEALRVAKARGRVAASVDAPSLLSGFPFQGSGGRAPVPGDAVPPPPRPRLDVPAPASRGAKDLAAHNTPGPAWAPPASARRTPKPVARHRRDRSAVVVPDPSRAPTETTSKFWGVCWDTKSRRWKAEYKDATGKRHTIGYYDTEEAAAHAVNAAIGALPPEVQRRRHTNPVVDGQLVPKPPRAGAHNRKRRRDESAAPPPAPSRRRVVSAPPPPEHMRPSTARPPTSRRPPRRTTRTVSARPRASPWHASTPSRMSRPSRASVAQP